MALDLHTHTIHSDGTTTPGENVALAASAGLAGVAITDHDTLAGWEEAAHACARLGLEFVPGVELSTEDGGVSIHALGYWVDPYDEALQAECDRLRNERARRADRIVARLGELGMPLDPAAVRDRAGTAPIGRPHIAQAMVAAGHVASIQEAFDLYLADGGPAYVVKHALSPEEGVRLIRGAGGVAVLAHPGLGPLAEDGGIGLVDRLCGEGLAGIEAEHAAHGPEIRRYWRDVARKRDLVSTGSSDFHGERKDAMIGVSTTTIVDVDVLRERAAATTAAGRRVSW